MSESDVFGIMKKKKNLNVSLQFHSVIGKMFLTFKS